MNILVLTELYSSLWGKKTPTQTNIWIFGFGEFSNKKIFATTLIYILNCFLLVAIFYELVILFYLFYILTLQKIVFHFWGNILFCSLVAILDSTYDKTEIARIINYTIFMGFQGHRI